MPLRGYARSAGLCRAWQHAYRASPRTPGSRQHEFVKTLLRFFGQDKDKLPAPLKTLDLGSAFKAGVREGEMWSPSNTDRYPGSVTTELRQHSGVRT